MNNLINMFRLINYFSVFGILMFSQLNAQNGIRLNSDEAFQGYAIVQDFGVSYLIDNCGDVVKEWDFYAGYHFKMLPNGSLLYFDTKNILEVSWFGNSMSRAEINEDNLEIKYEVILLPNGNYLCIGRRIYDLSFFEDRGYNFGLGTPKWDDTILEIDPQTNQIVWEWNISDHVIQERDSNLSNYGSISENPQLLNLDAIATFDWQNSESFMINGMDYNEDLDQIILSIRKISEVIIIDHSTTTEEASGHSGGRSNKGGDILFRWGNPQNYNKGTAEDRVLYFQHNPNWIKYGEHRDKIIILNNGLERPNVAFGEQYSSVDIINPIVQSDGNYLMDENGNFEPVSTEISITPELPDGNFYSSHMSGAAVLPNGNIFCSLAAGASVMEFNLNEELVWYYKGRLPAFRVEKYATDYPAFEGRNLDPKGPIEGTESNYDCEILTSLDNQVNLSDDIKLSLGNEHLFLESFKDFKYCVLNLIGQKVNQNTRFSNFHAFDKSDVSSGIYFINVEDKHHNFSTIKVFIH